MGDNLSEIRMPHQASKPNMSLGLNLARRILIKTPAEILAIPEAAKLRYIFGLVYPCDGEMSLEKNPILVQCALSQLYLTYLPNPSVVTAFLAPIVQWKNRNTERLAADRKLWETGTNNLVIQEDRLEKMKEYVTEWCALYGCLVPQQIRPYYKHESPFAEFQYSKTVKDGFLERERILFDPHYIASRGFGFHSAPSGKNKLRRKDLQLSRVNPGKGHIHTAVLSQLFHEFGHLWQFQLALGRPQHRIQDNCLEAHAASAEDVRRERQWFSTQTCSYNNAGLPDYVQDTFRYETDPLEIFVLCVEGHPDHPFPADNFMTPPLVGAI